MLIIQAQIVGRYRNYKPVNFEEPKDPPESEDGQAKVSQLLDSIVQTVSALVARLSRPQTAQTPQTTTSSSSTCRRLSKHPRTI